VLPPRGKCSRYAEEEPGKSYLVVAALAVARDRRRK
jgi:hypothetical protein